MTGSVLVVGGGVAGRAAAGPWPGTGGVAPSSSAARPSGGGRASTCRATRYGPWPSWVSRNGRSRAAYPCAGGSTATAGGGCCSRWTRIASGATWGDRSAYATAICSTPSRCPGGHVRARTGGGRSTHAQRRRGRRGGIGVAAPLRHRDRCRRRPLRHASDDRRRRPTAVVDDRIVLAVFRRQPRRRLLDGLGRPGRDLPADPRREEPRLRVRRTYRGGSTGSTAPGDAGGPRIPEPVGAAVGQALETGQLQHASVDEVHLDRWHHGRLVLIGDAAHATGPVWAQGVAMALEDAVVLGECSPAALPNNGPGSGLRSNGSAAPGRPRAVVNRPDVTAGRAPGWLVTLVARTRPQELPGGVRPLRSPTLAPIATQPNWGTWTVTRSRPSTSRPGPTSPR